MIIFFLCFYFTRRWWARDIADAPVNTQHKTHWHNTCMGRICRRQTLASGKPYLFALNLLWLMWAWFYRVIETEDLLDIEELKSFSVMLMFGLSCISQSVSGRIYANAMHRLLFSFALSRELKLKENRKYWSKAKCIIFYRPIIFQVTMETRLLAMHYWSYLIHTYIFCIFR